MNLKRSIFLLLLFVSLASTRATALTAPDSIEVKGKAISGLRNVNTGEITVTRGNRYNIHVCTDTAGNFSFKIPVDREDSNKIIVRLHYVEQLYWTAEAMQIYTFEELGKHITIATTMLRGAIQRGCCMRYYYYFDPPGKMTLTREEINK